MNYFGLKMELFWAENGLILLNDHQVNHFAQIINTSNVWVELKSCEWNQQGNEVEPEISIHKLIT